MVKIFESFGKIDESKKELQRTFFRKKLLEQFESDKSLLISESDFLNNCKNEIDQLKEKVIDHINSRRNNYDALKDIKIKISDQSKEDKKKAIDAIKNEAYELYGENTCITITEFVNTAKKEMCINDINFIKSALESINFIEPQQPEPEEYDRVNLSAVQKTIYLNELEIFDFLRKQARGGLGISNDKLAILIGRITGENHKTIKSYLNKLPKKSETDEKHPYYDKERVVKIKEKLSDMGFKTKS